ncbi:MAG: preprotein translocase subunit SecE [Proteobacteria bacterium]|nr:MAG: preprotein translocase subunit SecE [Pseudomonadota bacterium]
MAIEMYRKGQGAWSRGLAAGALALVAVFGVSELHGALSRSVSLNRELAAATIPFIEMRVAATWGLVICGAVFTACLAGAWFLLNHPKAADFLIETGEEMRKVSWPWDPAAQGSYWGFLPNKGRELFNNSLVVIIGVFVVAGVLFAFDAVLQQSLSWLVHGG